MAVSRPLLVIFSPITYINFFHKTEVQTSKWPSEPLVLKRTFSIRKFFSKIKHQIKVSKSQKQLFLKLHCPKNERNILPYEARAEFCLIFRLFFGNGFLRKDAFEIYWSLIATVIIEILTEPPNSSERLFIFEIFPHLHFLIWCKYRT